ncbi:DUF6444 domain-containing protein [Corallococcus terminator]|uniref:DUF6444 domain-containing protein n=1 Tax=Corallococcus terminator TaxID=2316733 RepID=UPI0035561876
MATPDPRDARITEQDARTAELEARLLSTSRNSSKPPSSDPPEPASQEVGADQPKARRPARPQGSQARAVATGEGE